MTAPPPQPEVTHSMYEQLRVELLQLHREVAQLQQTMRLIQVALDTHKSSNTSAINSPTTTASAQRANGKALSVVESTTGISPKGFTPVENTIFDDSPIVQVPASSITIHDVTGIIALTNDPSIASSADPDVTSSKPSIFAFITNGNTYNAVAIISISGPVPTIHPFPRPPPEPDPNNNTNTYTTTTTATITTTKNTNNQQFQ